MKMWNVNFDLETARLRPGLQAPPPVIIQYNIEGVDKPEILHARLERDRVKDWIIWALTQKDILLTGHGISYDLSVMMSEFPELAPLIFSAYENDKVVCTIAREKLFDIKRGKRRVMQYNMEMVAKRRHLRNIPDKADPWRLRYWELKDTPVSSFPAEAVHYAKMDVKVGLELALSQPYFPDQFRQTRADFWLNLARCWGIMTDPKQVDEYYQATVEKLIEERNLLQETGIVRMNRSKDTKAAKDRYIASCRIAKIKPKLTDTGKDRVKSGELDRDGAVAAGYVSLNKDAVKLTGDPTLEAYARYGSQTTILSRVKRLKHGFKTPIQPSFDSLIETGRTSCRQGDVKVGEEVRAWGAQVQNVHQKAGLRECFHARPNHTFVAIDYKGCELHTVSQVNILMHRDNGLDVNNVMMAKALNAGRDVHLWFGGQLLGVDYAEAVDRKERGDPEIKEKRQMAKAADFGFPGGLGVTSFITYARGYGVEFDEAGARELKQLWLDSFPEFQFYFKWVRSQLQKVGENDDGEDILRMDLTHPYSNRVRGQVPFTVGCNSFFQGLAADMAKDAGFRVSKECYSDPNSALYGSRIVNFIHDELVIETPRTGCHDAATRMRDIMVEAGRRWCPDVPVGVDVSLMNRWTKNVPDNTICPTTGLYVPNEELPTYKGQPSAW